jgi:ribose 5-phosphate isomerase A
MLDTELAAVAAKALEWVSDGARIGLGSGRTTEAFMRLLGDRVRQGLHIRGVPTSSGTAQLAQKLGIPLDTLDSPEPLAVTVDGADEVEPKSLNLIKGWGGALVRERIVAVAARRQVILVTHEKLVERLGQRGRLPVEVIPFAEPLVRRRITSLGLRLEIRQAEGKTFVTDNGNWILDCGLTAQDDPARLEAALLAIPGVVDTGLFLGTAEVVLVAEGGQVRELRRSQI